MTIENILPIYLIASTLLLGFQTAIWSTRGWANVFIKTLYLVGTLTGTVVVAKAIL